MSNKILTVIVPSYNMEKYMPKCLGSLVDRMEIVGALKCVDVVIPEDNWEQKKSDVEKYGVDIFAMSGAWKPFFNYIAEHFAKAWVNRDGLNGELLVNGYLRAYLMLRPAFMVRPEQELGKRFSDYSLFPDRALDVRRSAKHSFVIELKYSKKGETPAEVAAKRTEALAQLKAYSEDPALPSLTAGTPTHYLYIHYQDFDQIACEEIVP